MAVENGEWVMHGLDWDNPYRIRSYQELINWIDEVGFLPLFKNEIDGFSAEEQVPKSYIPQSSHKRQAEYISCRH